MKLSVSNIGRVNNADIDIQTITVVAGENGSGKSTISKALYSIVESYFDAVNKAVIQKNRSEVNLIIDWIDRNVYVHRINRQFLAKSIINSYIYANDDLEIFKKKVESLFEEYRIELYGERTNVFNSKVSRPIINEERIDLELEKLFKLYKEQQAKELDYYLQYSTQLIFEQVFAGQISNLKYKGKGQVIFDNENVINKILLEKHKIDEMTVFVEQVGLRPVYITTSDLMDSISSLKKLFVSERNGNISYVNSQLTKLLMKEISVNELVAEQYQKIEEQKVVLGEIFNEVLEGEIYLEEGKLSYYDSWCESNIELQNIASGMKMFLILKRLINNGIFLEDILLIIDEPETNLHPEWQLVLAHLLVLLNIRLNVKIYLNSHSPYFVRAIEFYSNQYQILDNCKFYIMTKNEHTGMFDSEDVTEKLGKIYDKLAEPFNKIM